MPTYVCSSQPDAISPEQRRGLAGAMTRENIWVYVSELPAPQMIEFGEVLPVHGGEDAWMRGLPPGLRSRLQAFETGE